jgi:hypothetical protein
VFAPDIKIKTHPIRFGSGTWTAVTGVMTGTFTKPMPTPDGKSIVPTGKRFPASAGSSGGISRRSVAADPAEEAIRGLGKEIAACGGNLAWLMRDEFRLMRFKKLLVGQSWQP